MIILCDNDYLLSAQQKKTVEDKFGLKPINVLWLLDSISNYKILDVEDYIIQE